MRPDSLYWYGVHMFCFRSLWNRAIGLTSARLRELLLRVNAGLGVESAVVDSCDNNVEGVPMDELGGPVDTPRTAIGTQF